MAGRSQQGQVPSRYLAKYIHLYSMSAHRATVDLAGWAWRQAGKLEFAIVQALATGSCLLSAVMNTNRPITIDKYYPDSHPSRSTRIGSSLESRGSGRQPRFPLPPPRRASWKGMMAAHATQLPVTLSWPTTIGSEIPVRSVVPARRSALSPSTGGWRARSVGAREIKGPEIMANHGPTFCAISWVSL